jgi:hypothetical protein
MSRPASDMVKRTSLPHKRLAHIKRHGQPMRPDLLPWFTSQAITDAGLSKETHADRRIERKKSTFG